MSAPKIITTHVNPPIPIRTMDWQAHYEGEEDEQMDTGHGATEAEAIADLKENYPRDEPSPANFEETFGCPGCTCRMSSVSSASIDPPEPMQDRNCPHHGWAPDPDDARDRAIEDAIMERRS